MNVNPLLTRITSCSLLGTLALGPTMACGPAGDLDTDMAETADDEDLELVYRVNPLLTTVATSLLSFAVRTVAEQALGPLIDDVFPSSYETVELSEDSLASISNLIDENLHSAFLERDEALANSLFDRAGYYVRSETDPGQAYADAHALADDAITLSSYLETYGLSAAQVFQLVSSLKLAFLEETRQITELEGEPTSVVDQHQQNVCDGAVDDFEYLVSLQSELIDHIDDEFSDVRVETHTVATSSGQIGYSSTTTYEGCYDGPGGKVCTQPRSCHKSLGTVDLDCGPNARLAVTQEALSQRALDYAGEFDDSFDVVMGDGYCENMAALVSIANACDDDQTSFACPEAHPPLVNGPNGPAPTASCGLIKAGEVLHAGEVQTSCDGRFTVTQQYDGNLVIYRSGTALWGSGRQGRSGLRTVMQTDGNLVQYDLLGNALWSSGTHGHAGAQLSMQDDGNLVIYADGTPIWATGTNQ